MDKPIHNHKSKSKQTQVYTAATSGSLSGRGYVY